jgi:hypothetical protein
MSSRSLFGATYSVEPNTTATCRAKRAPFVIDPAALPAWFGASAEP